MFAEIEHTINITVYWQYVVNWDWEEKSVKSIEISIICRPNMNQEIKKQGNRIILNIEASNFKNFLRINFDV